MSESDLILPPFCHPFAFNSSALYGETHFKAHQYYLDMPFCFSCGTQTFDSADFCVKCGTKLDLDKRRAPKKSNHSKFCANCGTKVGNAADVCLACGKATQSNSQSNNYSQLKSATVAIVLSILIAGVGHLYLGLTKEAIPFLVASVAMFLFALTGFGIYISLIIWFVCVIINVQQMGPLTEKVNSQISQ